MAENSKKSSLAAEELPEISDVNIRNIDISDLDDVMVWLTDEKVSRFCTWDTYTSRDQALNYIKNIAIPHPWTKVICINNRAIGVISVTPNSDNDKCRAVLGYVLAYKYWGKGIVTKAVKMVITSIFDEWPYLERLEAIVEVNNKGSQRVLEKAGFQREGVLRKYKICKGKARDVVMFSFISTDNPVD